MKTKTNLRESLVRLCVSAMLMAMNVVCSSSFMSIPVPGGHLYINDAVICTAAIILDPVSAFLVGGFGAFLGDLLFYPAPMFVSLVTHGVQAVVIRAVNERPAERISRNHYNRAERDAERGGDDRMLFQRVMRY